MKLLAPFPSTQKQFDLLRLLEQELAELGVQDVRLMKSGFVLATIPATVESAEVPPIAFLAHVDTAPAFNGTGVKPIVHRNYDGMPIVLPDDPTQVLLPTENPYLAQKRVMTSLLQVAQPCSAPMIRLVSR
jgi:tripeptide aminopeptidase